jgi:DNA-binding winged helix-turn-helix (wHTH) protein
MMSGPTDTLLARADFLLGEWLVQPSLNRLTRPGSSAQIEPKLMDLLVFLAQHRGQVLGREAIVDAVWAKRFVADSALSRAVTLLRRALGDDASRPRYIETIAKRGYRVVARVEPAPVDGDGSPARPAPGGGRTDPRPAGSVVIWESQEIPLVEGINIIGRALDVCVRICSADVSRNHARITVCGDRAVIEDLGSKNGTFLAGRRITAPVEIVDGDQIAVGEHVLIFRSASSSGSTATAAPPEPAAG